MQTVGNFFKRGTRGEFKAVANQQLPLPTTLMGVEVEVDRDSSNAEVTFPTDCGPEWSEKHDGSLVAGKEYVLNFPLAGEELVNSIYKLYAEPTKVYRTFTGSTHIHIDMMDQVDIEALRTLVLMTYALENILYAAGDLSRQWCGFANRLTSAPAEQLEHILSIENPDSFNYRVNEIGRYYGLNLQALFKYGSAEFRYFPTAESAEELLRWVKLVQLFKKAAMEVGTVDKLLEMFSTEQGYNDFIAEYFSEYPTEVEAVGGYGRMKALVNKAMIIQKTKTPKKTATAYTKLILEGKFKDVFKKATKKLSQYKVALGFSNPGGSAPACAHVLEEYRNSTGAEPDLLLLAHSGSMYYGQPLTYGGYHWDSLTNMPWTNQHGLCEAALSMRQTVIDRFMEQGREAQARDAGYYFDRMSEEYQRFLNSTNSPEVDDDYDDEYEEPYDSEEEQEENL
jgi:hypothetical protein